MIGGADFYFPAPDGVSTRLAIMGWVRELWPLFVSEDDDSSVPVAEFYYRDKEILTQVDLVGVTDELSPFMIAVYYTPTGVSVCVDSNHCEIVNNLPHWLDIMRNKGSG